MTFEPVKGFKDFTGKEAEKRAVIMEIVKNVFERYGFQPADTPIIEYEDFVKSAANEDDEAISDIYKLKDKGGRDLALRYEFTFQLKRLMRNKKLPYKRFQIGPVFRDEPVQKNRLRQFVTCEADIVGSTIKDEAEVLSVVNDILNLLKIEKVIYVNNRQLLNEILGEFNIQKKDREKVIREIDKLDKLPVSKVKENLKKFNAEKILDAFKQKESYFKKFSAYQKIKELINYTKYYNINLVFLPSLARGLSYYNGTIFEVKTKKIKETICGGGAYNFNDTQCVGFGMSIDRLSAVSSILVNLEKYLVVSLNKDKEAISLAQKLRKQGKITLIYYGKPSKALQYASFYGINNVIFVGENEIKRKQFKVKNMKTGKSILLKIKF